LFSKDLILASTSTYRRMLLARLGVPFTCEAPGTDETALPGESAAALTTRLAQLKCAAVAARHQRAVVIGSDQAAVRGHEILGKPGSVARCIEQLQRSSGRQVDFLTAVTIIDTATGQHESYLDRTVVKFRSLSDEEIARYVAADQPLDCAGGFKAEALGIALFDSIESSDPSALTGLPLIWVSAALRRTGLSVP
jgi:septum formation protein